MDAYSIVAGPVTIARYVFEPDAPQSEAPKPYLHPLRTLTGAPLTVYRPYDHRWHKGLQMTWSHVSGDNFWGGPTFDAQEGYRWIENLGTIRHEAFTTETRAADEVSFTETLSWISSGGERWLEETRTHRFHSADRARGLWALDFTTTLANVRGEALEFGSPTTHGRPAAGYAGYFWRGPRSWAGGTISASTGASGADVMGTRADWVAFSGEHDELDGGATVIAFAGSSEPAVPVEWFVRSEPFACISPSASFHEEIVLAPDASLTLRHRHVFVDSLATADELQELGSEFAL
jgi:hypothetical protein